MFDETSWEERYRAHTTVWSGRPNPQLVAETTALHPGTALDAGCGEGADTLWLAAQGWRVTAVDFSTTALQRAAAQTSPDLAPLITWHHADLTTWAPPAARFDLVSAQFMHLPLQPRTGLYARLAAAVAPGGTLLIVGHDPSDLHTSMHRPDVPGMFFTAHELAADLDQRAWDVTTTDTRPRQATDQDGNQVTIHDTVLRATRKPL